MNPTIITLYPKTDGIQDATASVSTFEEAFGDYSQLIGDDDDFYNADSKSKKPPVTKSKIVPAKPVKEGYFGKEKHNERKVKRAGRRANRKAKYGARPLKTFVYNGVQKFKDLLPKLKKTKKANGDVVYQKTMPDGTTKEVPSSQVKTIPSLKGGEDTHFDIADVNTEKAIVQTVLADGGVDLSKLYTANETETIPNDQGVDTVYKKEDVVDSSDTTATNPPADAIATDGMSKGMKIGLIVGASVLVLGIIGFVIYKSGKRK